MFNGKTKALGLFLGAAMLAGSTPQPSEAGALTDWLFRRNTARTTAYRPWTTAYRPWTARFRPWWRRPTTAFYPTTAMYPGACNTCAPQQQVMVSYVPQTVYRTAWSRVPVTVYRPVTGVDPATGLPVTCIRPCSTWSWQAQRVPYTTYRPTYTTMRVPTAACVGYAGIGGSTCAPAAPAVQVIRGAPALPALPTTPLPTTPIPRTMPAFPAAPPAGTAPPAGAAPVPAATQPSLAPGGAATQTSFRRSITVPAQPPAVNRGLQPVPDPDAGRYNPAYHSAPPLLNPRLNTAARPIRQVASASPIAWPTSSELPVRKIATTQAVEQRWDDSGWEAAP